MLRAKEVAIIGAGPAGIAAAIQLKRCGIEPIIFERNRIGGLLLNANLVENYLGFPEGISGIELVELFKNQLYDSDIKVYNSEVVELDFENDVFLIRTKSKLFSSKIIVIASGTRPKAPKLEIPKGVKDKILYEVYPILEVRNKKIVIVGGGDAAFDYALNLAKRNDIFILNRSDKKKCLPLLWQRAMHSPKITYLSNAEIVGIKANGEGVIIECEFADEMIEFYGYYLVFAIGREPQINYFSKRLRENASALQHSSRLYFIGDVNKGIYRQTAIAVGDGVYTAMKVYQTLKGNKKP